MMRSLSESEKQKGFTVIELLVVIGIIALICSILIPVLGRAKKQGFSVMCLNNLRQLGFAFLCYADVYEGYAMPCYETAQDSYWWGRKLEYGIDHKAGFLCPFLSSELEKNSVYECPAQPYNSYRLQAKPPSEPEGPQWITSTYGYNGYYLCPGKSAWPNISYRPWQKITTVECADKVIVFADAMIDWDHTEPGCILTNSALLDPPYILSSDRRRWMKNDYPTTCFRHNNRANVVFVDGHCRPMEHWKKYISERGKIGSVSKDNAPHYVPDYETWPVKRRKRR